MPDFQPKLRNYGITWFAVRSPDGMVFQAFTTLNEELRRKLYSNLPDGKIEQYALAHDWALIEMVRLTPNSTEVTQQYRAIVNVQRHALSQVRLFAKINKLLQLLEQTAGYPLLVRMKIFHLQQDKLVEIARHNSGNTAFARLFMHQYTYGHD